LARSNFAAAGASAKFDRAKMEQTLAGLGNRVFLMNNVHEDAPVVFETRWVMSYLRGPLTRQQIKQLVDPARPAHAAAAPVAANPRPAAPSVERAREVTQAGAAAGSFRPVLPPEVPQFFLPLRSPQPDGTTLRYTPALLGTAAVYFSNAKAGVTADTSVVALAPLLAGSAVVADFSEAEVVELVEADLERQPADSAAFASLPSEATRARSYDVWKKSFADWLYRTRTLEVLSCPPLKLTSQADESERDFRARMQQAARELRDAFSDKLRQKYATKVNAINERIRRAEQAVEREKAQAQNSTVGAMLSVGSSIFGAFLGRKRLTSTNIGRAATAARSAGRAYEQRQDVSRAEENVSALQDELARVEQSFNDDVARHAAEVDGMLAEVQRVAVKPRKTDVGVRLLGLAWVPEWVEPDGSSAPAWR
jgi:hypothetical protein